MLSQSQRRSKRVVVLFTYMYYNCYDHVYDLYFCVLNKTPAKAFTPLAETKMGTRPGRAVTREFIGGEPNNHAPNHAPNHEPNNHGMMESIKICRFKTFLEQCFDKEPSCPFSLTITC